jgi:hypothetical protein
MIVFTIGNMDNYEKLFIDPGSQPEKVGRTATYEGGCIWISFKEAEDFINSDGIKKMHFYSPTKRWKVYGVEINSLTDISSERTALGYHCLLVDSKLIKLD